MKNERALQILMDVKKFMSMMLAWNLAIFAKLYLYGVYITKIFSKMFWIFLIYTVIICY